MLRQACTSVEFHICCVHAQTMDVDENSDSDPQMLKASNATVAEFANTVYPDETSRLDKQCFLMVWLNYKYKKQVSMIRKSTTVTLCRQ